MRDVGDSLDCGNAIGTADLALTSNGLKPVPVCSGSGDSEEVTAGRVYGRVDGMTAGLFSSVLFAVMDFGVEECEELLEAPATNWVFR